MENFVSKYSGKVLHPNHVLVLDKVYNLAKMYGRMEGYEADDLTDEQLKSKRALCERVLKVLDKIMPGRMRKRAMMMYELHMPLVMLSNRCLQRGPSCGVSPDQIKADLKVMMQNKVEKHTFPTLNNCTLGLSYGRFKRFMGRLLT